MEKNDKIDKDSVCHFCGSHMAKVKCDECGEYVYPTTLTKTTHTNGVTQKLCNYCSRLSTSKHCFEHSKKVFEQLNDREKLQYIWNNPTFAYLLLTQ